MADDILQIFYDGRIDARSLSEFMYKPADAMVQRRLAPSTHTFNHYLDYFDGLKAVYSQKTGTVNVNGDIVKTISQATDDAVAGMGFVTIDSFEIGATITERNQALRYATDGRLYRWAGSLPKVVAANSAPTNAGGIGVNKWLEVSDAALRQELASNKGVAKVGGAAIKFKSVADAKLADWLTEGMIITTSSYYSASSSGGASYNVVSNKTANGIDILSSANPSLQLQLIVDGNLQPATIGVRTDNSDGLISNHYLLQGAVNAGYKSFDFGGSNNKYTFNGQVGLKEQGFYNDSAYNFTATGALVTLKGSVCWLTTMRVALNNGVRGLGLGFTGKLFIKGFSFTGDNTDGIFDGDHIYNTIFTNNDCYRMQNITRSYAGRLSSYPDGYFQSIYIKDNHFSSCDKIMDGKRAFNVAVSGNTFEGCKAGIYIQGNGQPCISTIRVQNNVFEGGGLFLKLGDASAGLIQGNYCESNAQIDAVTEKCAILIDRGTTGSYLANYRIANNMFAGTLDQMSDTEYQAIKFVGYYSYSFRGTDISGNWANTTLTKAAVRNTTGNISPDTSKFLGTAADAKVEYATADKLLTVADNVTGGSLNVLWFDTPTNGSERLDMQFTAKVSCIARTSGGVDLTRFFATVDFSIYTLLVGGGSRQPINLGVAISNFTVIQQPESQIIDTVTNLGQKPVLTAPTATIVSNGNRHTIKISGFSATSSPTYGAITTLDTYVEITAWGGRGYVTAKNLIEYYKA